MLVILKSDSHTQQKDISQDPVYPYDNDCRVEIPVVESHSTEIAEMGESGRCMG